MSRDHRMRDSIAYTQLHYFQMNAYSCDHGPFIDFELSEGDRFCDNHPTFRQNVCFLAFMTAYMNIDTFLY